MQKPFGFWILQTPHVNRAKMTTIKGKEAERVKKSGYIGKITNAGAQVVKAPVAQNSKKGNATVKQGNDLRTGK